MLSKFERDVGVITGDLYLYAKVKILTLISINKYFKMSFFQEISFLRLRFRTKIIQIIPHN